MRRAAVSISANIAEGFRRRGQAEKARFMNIAEGSVEECRYFLILAEDLGYGETAKLQSRYLVNVGYFGVAENRRYPIFKPLRNEMFQPLRFLMHLVPGVFQDIVQKQLQQAVMPHNLPGAALPGTRQA